MKLLLKLVVFLTVWIAFCIFVENVLMLQRTVWIMVWGFMAGVISTIVSEGVARRACRESSTGVE